MTPQRASLFGLALVLVAACGSSSKTSSNPTPSPPPAAMSASPGGGTGGTSHALSMLTGNAFSSDTLTLKVGDSVVVSDTDSRVPHNFTVDGVGHSKTMNKGDTFSLTFPAAGHYTFVCTFHQSQGMKGTITVQ